MQPEDVLQCSPIDIMDRDAVACGVRERAGELSPQALGRCGQPTNTTLPSEKVRPSTERSTAQSSPARQSATSAERFSSSRAAGDVRRKRLHYHFSDISTVDSRVELQSSKAPASRSRARHAIEAEASATHWAGRQKASEMAIAVLHGALKVGLADSPEVDTLDDP